MPTNLAEPPSLGARARGVLRGAALLASAQLLARLFTMVFTLVVARLMSVEDFGAMNFALSALVVFALIQDLGISRTVVKEIARRPEDAAVWLGRLLPAKLLLGVVAAFLLPLLAGVAGFGASTVLLLGVAACLLPAGAVWLLFENATQGIGAVRLLAGVTVSNAVLQTVLGLAAALASEGNPRALVAAMGVANVLSTLILWRLLSRRVGPIRPTFDVAFLRQTIVSSLPYLSVAVAVAALGRIEFLLLARISGDTQAGIFAAAFKLFEALLFVLYATQIAMNPILAKFVVGDRVSLDRWLNWEFGVVVACIVPACILSAWLAEPVIGLLYPSDYAAAGAVLGVLASALPIVALQVFSSGVLILTDRQTEVMALNFAVLAAQVTFSLLLIPAHGAVGAALALACSQGVAAFLGMALLARGVAGPAAFSSLWRMLAGTAVAIGAGLATRAASNDLFGIAVALVVVACCLPLARVRLLPPH